MTNRANKFFLVAILFLLLFGLGKQNVFAATDCKDLGGTCVMNDGAGKCPTGKVLASATAKECLGIGQQLCCKSGNSGDFTSDPNAKTGGTPSPIENSTINEAEKTADPKNDKDLTKSEGTDFLNDQASKGLTGQDNYKTAGKSSVSKIVPCGDDGKPCTLCHLITGFHNLVTFLLGLIVTVALAGIFFAGVMYILSAGSEGMITSAKNLAMSSVIGFAIVLGAWLIINVTMWAISANPGMGIGKTNWYTFDCSSK